MRQEHALFCEEFKRQFNGSNSSTNGGGVPITFIMKPTSKAQGKGIFLINKLSQVGGLTLPFLSS